MTLKTNLSIELIKWSEQSKKKLNKIFKNLKKRATVEFLKYKIHIKI